MTLPRKKPLPPRPVVEIDWVQIRQEWESQDVSDNHLASRWGFKSGTSIRRRRHEEGWSRNIDAIAAKLVTEAVARSGVAEDRAHDPAQEAQFEPPRTRTTHSAHTENTAPSKQDHGAKKDTSTAQSRAQDADDERDLGTAKHLATIHARAIRQQVGMGEMAINTAAVFLAQIAALASSEDPEEIMRARAALLSVNPDKDSLAGITKAMVSLLEAGVKIKRAALGMDVIKTPEITAGHVANATAAKEVIARLDVETLMKMRNAAQAISRLPPPKTINQQGDDE